MRPSGSVRWHPEPAALELIGKIIRYQDIYATET